MFKHIKPVLPSISSTVYLTVLPILITAYTLMMHYTSKINPNQSNIFLSWYSNQSWSYYVNRATDFAFWGGVATVVLILGWVISMSRTTIDNHYAEESFVNFNVPTGTWHSHFVAMIIAKIVIFLGIVFSTIFLVGRSIPLLVQRVNIAANQTLQYSMILVIDAVLLMILVQYIFLLCIKAFRFTRVE